MKIGFALYPINSLGGIINWSEELAAGFKELGHSVQMLELLYKEKALRHVPDPAGYLPSNFPNTFVHQGKGWFLPQSCLVPYKGEYARQRAIYILSQFDLLIWVVPVPTKQKENQGNKDWIALYNLHPSTKQIAVVHDGNAKDAIPHILAIAPMLSGVACVHPCAYNGADFIPVPRAMILNPQAPAPVQQPDWEDRRKGFVNMQTFKAWKHVHELVEAIAYMPPKQEHENRMVAGLGIEYNYMTSKDKCKPQYFHPKWSKWPNQKFWDVALKNGMERPRLGYLNAKEVETTLLQARVLVDPSWSKKYAQVGDHFNRVVVDAIRCGAIPVARPLGISTNLAGEGKVFKPNVHYVPIPHDVTPSVYASIIHSVANMPADKAKIMQANGKALFKHFERKTIAEQFIKLANRRNTGYYDLLDVGKPDDDVTTKCHANMTQFFGFKTLKSPNKETKHVV